MNGDIAAVLSDLLRTLTAVLGGLILWLVKGSMAELKEVKSIQVNHGERLVALETTEQIRNGGRRDYDPPHDPKRRTLRPSSGES